MRVVRQLIILVLSWATNCASAGAPVAHSAIDGAWIGTIGDSKIIACFEQPDAMGEAPDAQYAYLRYMTPITLRPDASGDGRWHEGTTTAPTGKWRVETDQDTVRGIWSSPTGTRLPILLRRFQTLYWTDSALICPLQSDDRTMSPLTKALRINHGKARQVGGQRFHVLSTLDGAVSSLALTGHEVGITRINARLENELWGNALGYLSCPPLEDGKPDYEAHVDLTYRDEAWVSFISWNAGYCGGAYPFHGFSFSTWNVNTGDEVNLWTWIRDSRKPDAHPDFDRFSINYAAPPKLNEQITDQAVRQRLLPDAGDAIPPDECVDVLRENNGYQIRLSTHGLVFNPSFPHVAQACDDDIEIPYARLVPFLTEEGKSAVSALMKRTPK